MGKNRKKKRKTGEAFKMKTKTNTENNKIREMRAVPRPLQLQRDPPAR